MFKQHPTLKSHTYLYLSLVQSTSTLIHSYHMQIAACIFFCIGALSVLIFPWPFAELSAISLRWFWAECIFKSVYSSLFILRWSFLTSQRGCESTWYLEKCIKVISLFHRHEREWQNKASGSECCATGEAGRLIRSKPSQKKREKTSVQTAETTNHRRTENPYFISNWTVNYEGLTRSDK